MLVQWEICHVLISTFGTLSLPDFAETFDNPHSIGGVQSTENASGMPPIYKVYSY